MAYPGDLARIVFDRWNHIVSGEYELPACPPRALLKRLLDACYLAASAPDEGRYPKFNVVATPRYPGSASDPIGDLWSLVAPRKLSAEELRRLAPAVDLKKSAVWVTWDEKEWWIEGLVDLGTSWHRARVGLEYTYRDPSSLLIQVDRPGRLAVYQGAFRVASLVDGAIQDHQGIGFHLFLHEPANSGLGLMGSLIDYPDYEDVREFANFEFIALWNTYAAMANSISLQGHGGMLVIRSHDEGGPSIFIRTKYECRSVALREAFVGFLSARNTTCDYIALMEDGYNFPLDIFHASQLRMIGAHERLVEATRFVARLAECDGCITITDDLILLGFGGEVRAELADGMRILAVRQEMAQSYSSCDIEQFGMRHRSAIKLVSQDHACRVLAVSQDGPITAFWWGKEAVMVKKVGFLTNMNMPWA